MHIKYDNIISLGTNCEVSFRCSNLYKDYSTFPFSWVQIYNLDTFLMSLKDLHGMYQGDYYFDKDLIVYKKYNIGFHLRDHNGNTIKSKDEITSMRNTMDEFHSRMEHLIKKWINAEKENNAFIQYITTGNPASIKKYIYSLYHELSTIFVSFNLYIVVTKTMYKYLKNMNNKQIIIKYIKKVPKREEISNPIYSDRLRWLLILRSIKKGNTLRYIYSTYPTIKKLFSIFVK